MISTILINFPTKTWETRRKSWLIKCLMKKYDFSVKDIAKILDTSVGYINTKLARNSFSFDDILAIADASGYYLVFHDKDEAGNVAAINVEDWFKHTDLPLLSRLKALSKERETIKEAQQLYLQKKAELEELKAKYGFKD